ncbi:hypothetical protein ABK905_10100 [Acerihabitans sp. KWT182]|uniref:Uncharacterized protein n=1 Tax=Acerihabitans sp. KWT182 TaxID=3157919 RepID=A0AAU7QDU5_9GAMM
MQIRKTVVVAASVMAIAAALAGCNRDDSSQTAGAPAKKTPRRNAAQSY